MSDGGGARPRAPTLGRKLTFSLVVMVVVLGGAELALWLAGFRCPPVMGYPFEMDYHDPLHAKHPKRFWVPRPGTRQVNADGFRGPRGERPKPRDLLRVIVLGDSVAFGIGVAEDDTFPALLASLISAATAGRSEVLNLGVNGYNAYLESALFADIGASYEPDLVLLANRQDNSPP